MVEALFEQSKLEDGYASEAKEKVRFLKARCHVEQGRSVRPASGKSWWKSPGSRPPQFSLRAPRRDSRHTVDTKRQLLRESTAPSIPRGLILAGQEMVELLELPPGWNSYNAKPIRKENVNFAFSLLGQIMRVDTPVPNVVPLVRGGVQFEWHTRGVSLEISIYSPTDIRVIAEDIRRGKEPVEGELDLAVLRHWVERLSS